MNQLAAFKETISIVEKDWEAISITADEDFLTLSHAKDMLRRIEENPDGFSPAKLGRWLGWLQGVACALGLLTLDACKQINQRYAD